MPVPPQFTARRFRCGIPLSAREACGYAQVPPPTRNPSFPWGVEARAMVTKPEAKQGTFPYGVLDKSAIGVSVHFLTVLILSLTCPSAKQSTNDFGRFF